MSSSSPQENTMNSKNFSESYSMLMSQYFKENKGSSCPTPMNFSSSVAPASLPVMDLSPSTSSNREVNVMDLFPRHVGFGTPTAPSSLGTPKKSECERAHQMTIFYGGKVVVFDDLSVAKAHEVLDLAKIFSVSNRQPSSDSVAPKELLPPRPHQQQKQLQTINASDLPISRNASLHRFLAKRKDRINSRAPYQVADSPSSASGKADHRVEDNKKVDERKIWLSLGSQSSPSSD